MSLPRLPWFGWAILAFIVLNVVMERNVGFVPLVIIGVVLASVAGSQQRNRRRVPPPQQPYPQDTLSPTPRTPSDGPMPTIDVPRYPGSTGPGMTSSLGSDPTVSFAQLQLGEAGRSLEQAVASGHEAGVEQALRRLQSTVTQVRPSLEGAGTPQARTLRATLDGLGAAVPKALAQPPGPDRSALVERVLATCRSAS